LSPDFVSANLRELAPDGSWRFWAITRSTDRGVLYYYSFWDTRSEHIDCNDVERSTDLRPDELAPSWAGLRTPPDTGYEIRWVLAFGWPVVSMWSDHGSPGHGGKYELWHGLRIAFLPPDPDEAFVPAVPLNPIWPGFAVNTLFYAALLWLLIPGPFALRRFIRVRRGLCPACAYPRGESDVCSECGKALPSRAGGVTAQTSSRPTARTRSLPAVWHGRATRRSLDRASRWPSTA